jgi:hypothetical protein
MAGLIGDIGLHISVGFCVIICIGAMICCPTGDVGSHVAVTGAIGCACHAGGGVFNCTSSAFSLSTVETIFAFKVLS